MSLPVFWSEEATDTFNSIVLFIENKWGERQASIFVKHTQRILSLIAEQPYMYKASMDSEVRQATITPQTSLYYEIRKDYITLLLIGTIARILSYDIYFRLGCKYGHRLGNEYAP